MKYILLSIYLMLQCFYALCTLPAPVNVTIDSLNFHHVLRWIPGPGTPPGTMYKILHREDNMTLQLQHQTNMTNQKLDLKYPKEEYRLCVRASHELFESPLTVITFTPYTQTVIGPPTLSLDGCGNCLVINITLPEMETIQNVYGSTVSFQIDWKSAGETRIKETRTTNLSYMLENLNVGTEYCVRVHTMITTNQKTQLSEWKCAHTSIVEANRVPAVVAGVSVLLIVSGAGLMVLMFVLFYTGFLCKLKAHLPRSLTALVEGYLVTPERTVPDLVSISSEPEQQGKALTTKAHHNRENSNRAGEEEEEEDDEEEGGNGAVYMDRDAGLSFDSSSSTIQSQEASGANVALLNVAGHSGGLSFETAAEEEVPVGVVVLGGQGQSEVKGELTKVISSLDRDQPRPLGLVGLGGEEEKEMSEVEKEMREETSGNVNLFSVTLGALKREEEEEHETDVLLGCSKQEQKPLLPIDSLQRTLGLDSMGSQGEIQEGTGLVLSRADCTHTYFEYSDRHAVSCTKAYSDCLVMHTGTVQSHNETEEEEEEEDFSGYMGH
ncbi:interferon lambda receptor 1-like [Oncorhynchus nerka]|uniref:interferon lambda receptor 1-like n=1 Tax=Oncorhynchus nerka TaxID=8023 RepID=UPI0031B85720